jgi:hypothetical protein
MRSVLLGLLLLAMTATAARAADSRVTLDAELLVWPTDPIRLCMHLPPGTVAVTTRLTPGPFAQREVPELGWHPIDVSLSAYRGRSDTPGVMTTATAAEALAVTPIPGGVYCLDLVNGRSGMPPGANPSFWAQWVAVKITHEPAP